MKVIEVSLEIGGERRMAVVFFWGRSVFVVVKVLFVVFLDGEGWSDGGL